MDPLVGKLVDERYQILEAMAAGSMGAVYRAERVPVGKQVAIKFLHASFANEPEFQIRFERETQVMSKLAHPNCVSIVDFGVWEDAPYLVMELVSGTTLRALLDDDRLPIPRALGLMRQIAAGLAYAHAQEIVHRDIKPANIMISDEIGTGERVRILDFGLARLRTGGGRDATQHNVVVGTPNYMAPEQTIGGGLIDARTDIYAAGVVLFEMLTGDRPFAAEETLQLLAMHRAAKIPRLAERAPGVEFPDGVQELVDKAMAKRPAERFQTAIELASAIDAILDARPAELRVSGSRPVQKKPPAAAIAPTELDVTTESPAPAHMRSWRLPAAIGAAMLVGIIGVTAYLVTRPGATAPADALAVVAAVPVDAPAKPDALVDAVTVDAADEIEMDPTTAEDLDPHKTDETATDEAANAPSTQEEIELAAPAPPEKATTYAEAVQLIRDGQRDLALTSLRALMKQQPKRGDIPFLIGNLYADQLWWSAALDFYKAAITRNGGYQGNPTIIKNVIRMLASPKTQRKAAQFLRVTVGHPAVPYIHSAAKSDPNPIIRKQAQVLGRSVR